MTADFSPLFERAAAAIRTADGLLITAGAGLGVDSGLPDFRGDQGLWRAYPALQQAGLSFTQIANPAEFARRPKLAWGFYGHRLALYRATAPGPAFAALHQIADRLPAGAFVFTSNVDGHFQRAGFAAERIAECHGSIHHLQCTEPCCDAIWPADAVEPVVDTVHCELRSPLPLCPHCGALARPNILMFGDWNWLEQRTEVQHAALRRWQRGVDRLVTIELGAGTAVPTVRMFSERQPGTLIRINLREAEVPRHHAEALSLPLRASEAMAGIVAALEDS